MELLKLDWMLHEILDEVLERGPKLSVAAPFCPWTKKLTSRDPTPPCSCSWCPTSPMGVAKLGSTIEKWWRPTKSSSIAPRSGIEVSARLLTRHGAWFPLA
ncbi:MAG: hypothetical protein AUK47_29225 [Deltaproteobacteria bacterium CG2_30_63_29]|nr:MAG: hypothetical protein AUK47_29225 [Deltaproteobacteria bacterium CG2_30_63_29]PIW02597.1 MAG: hypothetical protein COW42_00800 [Deltaproteobacteria bacterium CG17_big_fil_post_rev_8_21_14_2_50_63_7]PJB49008.1 MAG: hypothetical protein CO108_01235 [Deltaproteobacteria bacterium CG_4_9_14_3_um_filter_63_12]